MDVLIHIAISNLQCFRQTNNAINIFCSATHVAFLCATVDEGLYLFIFSDKHKTYAFRSVKFMSSGRKTVNFYFTEVVNIVTKILYRVGMKIGFVFITQNRHALKVK